jgi:8-oxo-dGTP pyrophosphatase MutT (NUDIX family)
MKKLKNPVPLWNIVKGTYGDSGLETIFAAAVREAKEETGLEVELTDSLGCYVSQADDEARVQFTFVAKIISGNPVLAIKSEQIIRNENIIELKWFDKSELEQMKASDFISNRTYVMISDWLKEEKYPISAVKQVKM